MNMMHKNYQTFNGWYLASKKKDEAQCSFVRVEPSVSAPSHSVELQIKEVTIKLHHASSEYVAALVRALAY